MQGYYWAKTPENALFVVLVVEGRGYVPGVEHAIDLDQFYFIEPVQWPQPTAQNQNSDPTKPGQPAADATPASNILRFAASA